MAQYPDHKEISDLFKSLADGNAETFFARVSPTVTWDVLGHHPCAGHFTTLADWKQGALAPINAVLREPLRLQVVNIAGGGEQPWAVIELKADAVCKNGMKYPQRYAWVTRFDERGVIVEVRAYLDSALVQKAIDQNKS